VVAGSRKYISSIHIEEAKLALDEDEEKVKRRLRQVGNGTGDPGGFKVTRTRTRSPITTGDHP